MGGDVSEITIGIFAHDSGLFNLLAMTILVLDVLV